MQVHSYAQHSNLHLQGLTSNSADSRTEATICGLEQMEAAVQCPLHSTYTPACISRVVGNPLCPMADWKMAEFNWMPAAWLIDGPND